MEGLPNLTSFGDGFAFLLASQSSLDNLNTLLPKALPINRFRPNMLVEPIGPEDNIPWIEDDWYKIEIAGQEFYATKPCTRCKMTTVNQSEGAFDGDEPLNTLRKHRASPDGKSVYFGQNLVHAQASGVIAVGDTVTVLSTKQHKLELKPK